jgi:hypothetical protein
MSGKILAKDACMKIQPLKTLSAVLLLFAINSSFGQVSYSANVFGKVTPYTSYFQYGTNMGYYGPSWDDKSLADISAGSVSKNVKGVGAKTLRLFLPEDFLETWGYDVRVSEFNYYNLLGISEKVVARRLPQHTDQTSMAAV